MAHVFCGFGGILIVTQIYGLDLLKKVIVVGSLFYLLICLYLYIFYPNNTFSSDRLKNIHQITWIPITEYVIVFSIVFILWLIPGGNSKKEKTIVEDSNA